MPALSGLVKVTNPACLVVLVWRQRVLPRERPDLSEIHGQQVLFILLRLLDPRVDGHNRTSPRRGTEKVSAFWSSFAVDFEFKAGLLPCIESQWVSSPLRMYEKISTSR